MPTNISRFIDTDLETEFGKTSAEYCYIWAIEPDGYDSEGYTTFDKELIIDAVLDRDDVEMVPALTYVPDTGAEPTDIPIFTGLSDDTVDVTQGVTIDSVLRRTMLNEKYRNAVVTIMACKYTDLSIPPVILMSGKLGKGKLDDTKATFELRPWSHLLQRNMLRTVGPLCDCPLYRQGACAANGEDPDSPDITEPGFRETGTITAVVNAAEFTVSVTGKGDGWASFGRLWFEGAHPGNNVAVQPRTVKLYETTGHVILANELPSVPEIGDTIVIEEGCDRSWNACQDKNNTNNFQGFPFVPGRQGMIKRYGR